jgi:hypothetical protein
LHGGFPGISADSGTVKSWDLKIQTLEGDNRHHNDLGHRRYLRDRMGVAAALTRGLAVEEAVLELLKRYRRRESM